MLGRTYPAIVVLGIASVSVLMLPAAAQMQGPNQLMAGLAPGPGARAAAMGEAHVAVARDASALYWNPAGLALGDDGQWHAVSARYDGHHLHADELGDMLRIAQARRGLGMRHFNLLRSVAGSRVEAGGSALSAYRDGRWAFGVVSQGQATLDVTRYPPERYWLLGYGLDATSVGAAYGGSLNDRWRWGVQAGWLKAGMGRTKGSVLEEDGAIVSTVEYFSNHATDWSATAGLLYQPSDHVSWGLVVRNLNSPRLFFEAETIQEYEPSVHVGFAAQNPEEGVLFALDVHNVFEAKHMAPQLCVGLEKTVGPNAVLRVGGTRSRLTFGAGIQTGSWQIDLASGSNPASQLGVSGTVDF